MSDEKPPRLIDDPAFRDALRAVKDEGAMPAERLAANKRAIEPTISQPPPAGAFPLGTVALTLAGIAGLVAVLWTVAPALFPAATGDDVTPTPTATATKLDGTVAEGTPSMVDPPASATIAATPIASTTPVSTVIALASPVPPVPTVAAGTLAEELALYDSARALAKSGDDAGAIAKLDELAKRFPLTTLGPEAAITRAEVLVKAKRFDEASVLLSKLVTDPVHAGRRAELERTLGDVERERGDCASARTHYRTALDVGARGDEASAVRRGLGMCEAQ